MSALELRAALSLSSIYALRMLGLFVILPVFAIHARTLPGADAVMVGWVLGIYGLTQGILQIPFGMASDRIGRKPVIAFGLLLFAIGSFVAAIPGDIWTAIIGRSLQGAGAISAAVTALLADLTSDENRTKAMALVGATVGLMFAVSLVAAPILFEAIGMHGIFIMTGVLATAAVAVVVWVVPAPPKLHEGVLAPERPSLKSIFFHPELLRLNIGIFVLHTVLMAIFIVVPIALLEFGHMPVKTHWKIYLPAVLLSFAAMIPPIIWAEKRGHNRTVLLGSVAFMGLSVLALIPSLHSPGWIAFLLFVYFAVFNILEAQLPSLVSRFAPPAGKGTALGVYNTTQALGLAAGGALGGYLVKYTGLSSVFVFGAVMMFLWFITAFSMREPEKRRPASANSLEGELKHGLSQ
jgi:MFS family permease